MEGFKLGSYVINGLAGNGCSGTVYTATHIPTNKVVAIKEIEKTQKNVQQEISIMKMVNHPFIVALFEVLEDAFNYYLVMEFVEGITLLQYIKEQQSKIADWVVKHILCQILSALHYLHQKLNVVHRDLKLENIMLDKYMNVRLLDFGLSKINKNDELETSCGSMPYIAPELCLGHKYGPSVDVWSFGVIAYALLHKTFPFNDPNVAQFYKKVISNEPYYSPFISQDSMRIIKLCLNKNAEERPTVRGLIEESWIKSYPNGKIFTHEFGLKENWIFTNRDTVTDKINKRATSFEEMRTLIRTAGHIKALFVKPKVSNSPFKMATRGTRYTFLANSTKPRQPQQQIRIKPIDYLSSRL